MTWAGLKDTIRYTGTGMRKVNFACLQEVFLTPGRKRVETIEVLRVRGPFPKTVGIP